jgi:Trm5-related predicted tRNA methylase
MTPLRMEIIWDRDLRRYVVLDPEGWARGDFPTLHEAECFVLEGDE